VTLTRLVFAWLAVAVWFVIATAGSVFLLRRASQPPGQDALSTGLPRPMLTWRLVEALLLTLLGALWFDSLGTGEWWLVFLLVGAIAATPKSGRVSPLGVSADLARYVLAGAILAWRLG
jgi:hypothetical protein